MRAGAEYFLQPGEAAQRQYEALRAYFVEHATAAEVAEAYGYTVATVQQMADQLRAGRAELFCSSKPVRRGHPRAARSGTGCSHCARADR